MDFHFYGVLFFQTDSTFNCVLTKLYDVENVGYKTDEKIYYAFQSSVSVAA